MAYRLDFHPEAEAEFEEAIAWYASQREGLELEFFEDYLALENSLEQNPHQFPAVIDEIRRANFRRFPYSIFFESDQAAVLILAVFHQSRNPEVWKKRAV